MTVGMFGLALAVRAAFNPAQDQAVHYDVRFSDPGGHEVEITATFRQVPEGPLAIRMSRSSPGRYAVHEFAKNLYRIRITDGAGRPLAADPDRRGNGHARYQDGGREKSRFHAPNT